MPTVCFYGPSHSFQIFTVQQIRVISAPQVYTLKTNNVSWRQMERDIKAKFTLEQAVKAQMRNKDIALLFL